MLDFKVIRVQKTFKDIQMIDDHPCLFDLKFRLITIFGFVYDTYSCFLCKYI